MEWVGKPIKRILQKVFVHTTKQTEWITRCCFEALKKLKKEGGFTSPVF